MMDFFQLNSEHIHLLTCFSNEVCSFKNTLLLRMWNLYSKQQLRDSERQQREVNPKRQNDEVAIILAFYY